MTVPEARGAQAEMAEGPAGTDRPPSLAVTNLGRRRRLSQGLLPSFLESLEVQPLQVHKKHLSQCCRAIDDDPMKETEEFGKNSEGANFRSPGDVCLDLGVA